MPILQTNRNSRLIVGDLQSGNGIELTEHQITFDILKSSDNSKNSNSASIEICNLSDETLKTFQIDYPVVSFEVGYGSERNLSLLFAGEVVHVSTRKNGTDRVTQIILGNGYTELNHQTISKLVPPGKTVRDVFEELRKAIPNVSRGVYNGTNLNSQLINGYNISGSVKQSLDSLANSYKVEWRIDGEALYVNDKNRAESENFDAAYIISPNSGLIEIPYYVSGDKRRSTEDSAKKQSVQFSMLINPAIRPGMIIKLENTEINGWYKVDTVRFSGSYRGGNWLAEVSCSAIEKVIKTN